MCQQFTYYQPSKEDGWDVSRLIQACPPLDTNSVYCNLLQCHHFSNTSVAVRRGGELVGFVSGYLIPDKPDRLFIWQVAVSDKARGQGIASEMIQHILSRENCRSVRYVETTITATNHASWALFRRIAESYNAPLSNEALFTKEIHFSGHHDTESLVTIGPFVANQSTTHANLASNVISGS